MSERVLLQLVAFMACTGTTLHLLLYCIIMMTRNEWGEGGEGVGIYVTYEHLPEITKENCETV